MASASTVQALPAGQGRAVGVIRVSRVGDREGERFISPLEQREAIERLCLERGLDLVDCFEEPNVSGGRPLKRRPGLLAAVNAIEGGQADVLVVAFFDRLARHVGVLAEMFERVEGCGGKVTAVDVGDVGTDTPARFLSSSMLGLFADYQRRVVREHTSMAKRRAVARGVPPFPVLVAGYRRTAEGTVEVDPEQAPLVQRAFELRAGGATIREVRDFLRAHGIPLDHQRTRTLLRSRFVLGELRHGAFVKLDAHPPIVERELWQRVQQQRVPSGRRPQSERLLARLGVVRCATCGRPLSVGGYFRASGERVATYGCTQPDAACPRPARINADVLEPAVTERVRAVLRGHAGRATHAGEIAQLEALLAERQARLQRAIETLHDFEDVAGTRERLLALRASVKEVEARLEPLRAVAIPSCRLSPSTEWARLSLAEQRDLVRALVERVEVAPGRGPGRVSIKLFGE